MQKKEVLTVEERHKPENNLEYGFSLKGAKNKRRERSGDSPQDRQRRVFIYPWGLQIGLLLMYP